VQVAGADDSATVEGALAGRPLLFFPYRGSAAALVGVDLETEAGRHHWIIATVEEGRPRVLTGRLAIVPRLFSVERLTLPREMVDLDEATARRADRETAQLRSLFGTVTAQRLWRGPFVTPVPAGTGTGFGARRIINGRERSPHSGLDYPASPGAIVVAANSGRVALVADFFFPGRLVVLDHGLGLYTAYFHLQRAMVGEQEWVSRGRPIGVVGATGRATGPHLHFAVTVGSARVDPAQLLGLDAREE
jgi:murein DD-endopeptidase MepM/ murein hydrolase activator NlpD